MDIDSICTELRKGAETLALHNEAKKNYALSCVSKSLQASKSQILQANARDVERARNGGMVESLVERLALDDKKFSSILNSIDIIIQQRTPYTPSESSLRSGRDNL